MGYENRLFQNLTEALPDSVLYYKWVKLVLYPVVVGVP
jgi:hypothetical protein